MAGSKSGVMTQILREEPCALYTHCYGHSLSLSVGDTVKGVKFLQSIMDVTHELSKLIQYSPKRRALLATIKADLLLIQLDFVFYARHSGQYATKLSRVFWIITT